MKPFPQKRIDEIVEANYAAMRKVEELMAAERAAGLRCSCCNGLLKNKRPKWCPECGDA